MIRFKFKHSDPLKIDILNEAKTKALDFLEREFGHDRVFSTELIERFSQSLYKKIFRILNATLFANRLKPIPTVFCAQNEIQEIAKKVNQENYNPNLKY